MNTKLFIYILFVFTGYSVFSQYEISGQLSNYEQFWHSKIYMAYIGPEDSHNRASSSQIINSTTLDEEGNFVIKGNNLPMTNSIVRLYLVKNEKIQVMLSQEPKNYILLIVNDHSKIHVAASDFSSAPNDYNVTGDFQNQNIKIKELEKELYNLQSQNSSLSAKSSTSKKLITSKRNHIVKKFCTPNTFPLVTVLALQKLNLEHAYSADPKFYENIILSLQKNDSESSSYSKALKKKLDLIQYKIEGAPESSFSFKYIVIGLSLIIILLLWYIIRLRKKIANLSRNKNPSKGVISVDYAQVVQSLTKREKEILELILQDYQNKEIATQLHLEVSTIKSHLSKIYVKLDVENRNQLKKIITT